MTDIETRVRQIVTISARDNRMEPVFASETLETIGVDSLERHEIAMNIEQEFKIDLDDGVPEAWTTVQDVIHSVLNEMGKPQTGDFVNVTIHSDGKVDVINRTSPHFIDEAAYFQKPAINRIERADVEHFRQHDKRLFNTYQRIATKSAIYPGKGTPFGLMYAALGLAEAGEVQNKSKKAFRDDGVLIIEDHDERNRQMRVSYQPITPERRAQIIKELGGNLWYIAAVCDEIGATMSEVALANLDELCGRGERETLRGDGDNR